MTIKYSASARGFFDTDLHKQIPDDAVSVTARRHAELLAGQAAGGEIVPDKRGRPQMRPLAPATLEQARAACVHAIKREAGRRIDQRMPLWRQINALRDDSDPGFHAIDLIRSASNLIEEQLLSLPTVAAVATFPVSDNPLWPQFDQETDA
ncbi:hypothetical protein GCM10009424_30690 [Sphingomonas ursincola]|uniref:Uncharacterized protein n=1 Tax=Sphingomonas ursincola TaxID=56361 RepID=A0A7V8RB58_9SPHN|nr:hypothetical protein [Sphingomonas ursincola]MBA1373201.1 hypothetical protein [Sphingomonas ursincola]